MATDNRLERIATILEQQLQRCQRALADCTAQIEQQGRWADWELRSMLSLMKTSAQLATVIGRLDRAPPSKNRESGGSIPQENCA